MAESKNAVVVAAACLIFKQREALINSMSISSSSSSSISSISTTSSSSSSSDDSDTLDVFIEYLAKQKAKKKNRRKKRLKTAHYSEEVVPRFSSAAFRSHFRITREAVDKVAELIGGAIENCKGGQRSIDPYKQILMTVIILGTGESYRSVANTFNVGESTLWRCFGRVVRALTAISYQIVEWPSAEKRSETANEVELVTGFPGVIGFIDAVHIPIKAPHYKPECYVNADGYHSLILQAVCDNSKKFIHCYAGCPGSIHDARVFALSDLETKLSNEEEISESQHVLGDSLYPNLKFLMASYDDCGDLSQAQKSYNAVHSAIRSKSTSAFSLLKGRWRRLKHLDMSVLELMPKTIIAACVLHNVCLDFSDSSDEDFEDKDELDSVDVVEDYDIENDEEANEKRENIVRLLSDIQ